MVRFDMRALIVAEDEDSGRFLCSILATLGCGAEWTRSGAGAGHLLERHRHDLLFLDVDVPLDACRPVLRALGDGRLTPRAIAVMGSRCLLPPAIEESGEIAFLEKPLDDRAVAAFVRAVHEGRAGASIGARREARVPLRSVALLRSAARLHPARVVDLGPGGLGLDDVPIEIARDAREIEFRLPRTGEIVTAAVRPAWAESGHARAGLEFVGLRRRARRAIAEHVRSASEGTASDPADVTLS